MCKAIILALVMVAGLAASPALAGEFDAVQARLAADGIPRPELKAVFGNPQVRFTPEPMGRKLLEMYTAKFGSDVVRSLQQRFASLGYFFGPVSGRPDYLFRSGVKAFQRDHGLPVDGRYSLEILTLAGREQRRASPETSQELKTLADNGPPDVYEAIVTPERLAEARDFFEANRQLLEEVRARYGVPPEAAVGLLSMETRMGRFLGDNLAVNNLASMAACTTAAEVMEVLAGENVTSERRAWLDARAAEKSSWAYGELKALFAYAGRNRLDLTTMPGSIYGAIGISQFMPSSLPSFGVSGGSDGRVDIFRLRDAALSMGNFLHSHGFTGNLEDETVLREALFRYNHSQTYVNTIMTVAHALKGGVSRP